MVSEELEVWSHQTLLFCSTSNFSSLSNFASPIKRFSLHLAKSPLKFLPFSRSLDFSLRLLLLNRGCGMLARSELKRFSMGYCSRCYWSDHCIHQWRKSLLTVGTLFVCSLCSLFSWRWAWAYMLDFYSYWEGREFFKHLFTRRIHLELFSAFGTAWTLHMPNRQFLRFVPYSFWKLFYSRAFSWRYGKVTDECWALWGIPWFWRGWTFPSCSV
jgi:hypothetical protein